MRTTEDVLRLPTEAEVDEALKRFAANVRRHYGVRLKGLYLFGSRARGGHRPDSDVDVAVVTEDIDQTLRVERNSLSDLSYDRLVDDGVEIQGWPVLESAWRNPEQHSNPSLIKAMQHDARPVEPKE